MSLKKPDNKPIYNNQLIDLSTVDKKEKPVRKLKRVLTIKKPEGTGGTEGTTYSGVAFSGSLKENTEGTGGTKIDLLAASELKSH